MPKALYQHPLLRQFMYQNVLKLDMHVHILNIESMKPMKKIFWGILGDDGPPAPQLAPLFENPFTSAVFIIYIFPINAVGICPWSINSINQSRYCIHIPVVSLCRYISVVIMPCAICQIVCTVPTGSSTPSSYQFE